MSDWQLWIGGEERKGAGTRVVRIPYDNSVFAEVEQADAGLTMAAVEAARRAAPVMREMSRAQRSQILRSAREALLAAKEEFAATIASEGGKPLREARLEVDRGASTLLFSAAEADRLAGDEVPMDASAAGAGKMAMTVREPLGVIGAITPFNFPLNLALHKIGPALAAGNSVVHKPASATPVTALRLARVFAEAGLPAGALNVIPGPGGEIGDTLVQHPAVAMITFTGSAEVGLALRAKAGMKRVTLELGSNSAVIIGPDADLERAAPRCVTGAFAHSGQVCISVQRVFVHEDRAERFVKEMAERAAALRIGHPLDPETEVSGLISGADADRVAEWTREATAGGARLVTGLERRGAATLTPAVVADAPEGGRLFVEEAFGPVVAVNRYEDLDDAIARVNASPYGLQASIFTHDLRAAFRAARRVEVGGFLINEVPQFRADQMPYGGVKRSGTGREGPRYAVEEMSELKLICWNLE